LQLDLTSTGHKQNRRSNRVLVWIWFSQRFPEKFREKILGRRPETGYKTILQEPDSDKSSAWPFKIFSKK